MRKTFCSTWVCNAIFNNISVVSWRSVLLVYWVPEEAPPCRKSVATLFYITLDRVHLEISAIWTHNLVSIFTDCNLYTMPREAVQYFNCGDHSDDSNCHVIYPTAIKTHTHTHPPTHQYFSFIVGGDRSSFENSNDLFLFSYWWTILRYWAQLGRVVNRTYFSSEKHWFHWWV